MKRLIVAMMVAAGCMVVCGAPKKVVKKAPAKKAAVAAKAAPAPMQTQFRRLPYVGAIAADADSGRILFSDNAERKAYPASVTKLMTALLVLEDVEKGKYKLTDRATASVRATFEQPSGVGIRPEQSMTIDDLLMALMVRSANDAAVMLAENSAGGDLLAFIARMNARATQLGMTNTKYDSPNGLPPYDAKRRPKKWRHGYDVSTAADILKLAREVVRHRQIFKYTSTKVATVTDGAGKPLKSVNHNNILVKDKQKILDANGVSVVDGLKTGYIDAGGSSIALTAMRGGKRAIVVVLGSATSKDRDANARSIMMRALDQLSSPTAKAPVPVTAAAAPVAATPVIASAADTQSAAEPAVASAPAAQPVAELQRELESKAGNSPAGGSPAGKHQGGSAWGWAIIGGAVVAGGVAYAAWSWLGKSGKEDWHFEDIPSEPPRTSV